MSLKKTNTYDQHIPPPTHIQKETYHQTFGQRLIYVEFSNNLNSKLKKCFGHGFGAYPCAKNVYF
jgi:hypothetical protein